MEVVLADPLGAGGAGGAGVGLVCDDLKVLDLDRKETWYGCETAYVGSEPGTYRLRIEYGDQVEERTVEVPASTGECGGVQTVTITAFEK